MAGVDEGTGGTESGNSSESTQICQYLLESLINDEAQVKGVDEGTGGKATNDGSGNVNATGDGGGSPVSLEYFNCINSINQ